MIRTLTDALRAEDGYGGPPVPIDIGIDVDDVKRDLHSPSGTALGFYINEFSSRQEFADFITNIITKPTGTALGGRLTWMT